VNQGTVLEPPAQPTSASSVEDLSAELVTYTGRLVRAISRTAPGDVPAATLRLLSQVEELGPVTIGALAQADRCSQPTMSAGISHLVDKGWATKEPNPADARSSLVRLTAAGLSVLRTARRGRAAVVADRFRLETDHDERDLATTVAVLRSLLEATRGKSPHQPTTVSTDPTTEGTA
jgi:DNA-binding MarR family transcriptional regulator